MAIEKKKFSENRLGFSICSGLKINNAPSKKKVAQKHDFRMKNSILFDFFSDELEINNGNRKKEIIR